jgi:hypothetical protein
VNLWVRIKSIGWLAAIGAALTAILMVLAGAKSTRLERRAKDAERLAEVVVQDHTKKNLEKAAKLQASAATDKAKAAELKEKSKARLEQLGDKDETLADLADSFNKRVRD